MTENQIRNLFRRELAKFETLGTDVEIELGIKAKKGDNAAINKLVLHNVGAAIGLALSKRFRFNLEKTLSEERTCDIAMDCLYVAIKRFDPTRNCRVMNLASRIIIDKIIDEYRRAKRTQIFTPIEDYADEEIPLLDTDIITACINRLPFRTRELLKWAFKLDGYRDISEQEIADEYSLTISRTRAIIREGIASLRSYEGLLRSA